MKTINTVIANIARIRKYSKRREDNIINEYWKIGKELSGVTLNIFGSDFINKIVVGLKEKGIKDKAYNRRGLYRMIQFYEAYPEFSIYGEYLKEINWSCHILILDNFKGEDRDFWIELCALKKYSVRTLRKLINQYREGIVSRAGKELELVQRETSENDDAHIQIIVNGKIYIVPSMKELLRMKNMDIREVDKEELVDIRDVNVDGVETVFEYYCSYLHQIKNPYLIKVGDAVIKQEFSEDGSMLEELIVKKVYKSEGTSGNIISGTKKNW
ncbi:MAG: DUF6870 family protein [Velocimicrobium sp.]